MNLFATNDCPVQSAKDHNDVHLVKMVTEVIQMLSTAHNLAEGKVVAMKSTHVNHPSCKWIRETKQNYAWAYDHAVALAAEYTHRTGKVHASARWLPVLAKAPKGISSKGLQAFAMAMPDEYKIKGIIDPTKAYREYLNAKFKNWATRTDKKRIIAKWSKRAKPAWVA